MIIKFVVSHYQLQSDFFNVTQVQDNITKVARGLLELRRTVFMSS
jgi:hypothetical protein